jgi:hypothetical protein
MEPWYIMNMTVSPFQVDQIRIDISQKKYYADSRLGLQDAKAAPKGNNYSCIIIEQNWRNIPKLSGYNCKDPCPF